MNKDEQELDALEATFPLLADAAFASARQQALAAGLSVLEVSDGVIYEVFPDGKRVRVKDIAKRVRIGARRFMMPPQ